MFEPDLSKENAQKFSRFDSTHLLSTVSRHAFQLDGDQWQTAEHYFQACLAANPAQAKKIRQVSAREAYRRGQCLLRRKRKDWKRLRRVLMTRALYTKARTWPAVAAFLLDTGDELIVETSLYDYYWGLGRDQRGENMLGEVWMDIRQQLRSEKAKAARGNDGES